MTEEIFKTACTNYINIYKDFGKKEFRTKPDNLSDGETTLKYFIKSVSFTKSNSAKFTYLQRKYTCKKSKVSFSESTKTFSLKLTESVLSDTIYSDKEYISENYLTIIAYVSRLDITNSDFVNQLENYIVPSDKTEHVILNKENDSRIGKSVKTLKNIMYKDGLLTKKSIGVIKSIKGSKLLVTFKEFYTNKNLDIEVNETDIIYIDKDEYTYE